MYMIWFTKYLEGDESEELQDAAGCDSALQRTVCEVNPIPVKAAMNLMGKEVGPLRAPLTEIEPQHEEILKKAMKEFGIL